MHLDTLSRMISFYVDFKQNCYEIKMDINNCQRPRLQLGQESYCVNKEHFLFNIQQQATFEPLKFQGNDCFVYIKQGLNEGVFEIKKSNSMKFQF